MGIDGNAIYNLMPRTGTDKKGFLQAKDVKRVSIAQCENYGQTERLLEEVYDAYLTEPMDKKHFSVVFKEVILWMFVVMIRESTLVRFHMSASPPDMWLKYWLELRC